MEIVKDNSVKDIINLSKIDLGIHTVVLKSGMSHSIKAYLLMAMHTNGAGVTWAFVPLTNKKEIEHDSIYRSTTPSAAIESAIDGGFHVYAFKGLRKAFRWMSETVDD